MTTRAATLGRIIRAAAQDQSPATDRELLLRFAEDGDQDAFATLVRRHTGLVLSVCRRALPTDQDAEDACQATFLILARKAGADRWQSSIANWLYTTARRVAGHQRRAAARRARREGRAAVPESVQPVDRMTGRELLGVIDEELDRLPSIYREPLLLFYLEGLGREEIATRLGIPSATVKTRLERGRRRLCEALTKRDVALGAGLLACAISSRVAAVPARVANAVLAAVRGTPPEAVAVLSRGVAVNGLFKKSAFVVLAAIGAMAIGVGLGSALPTAAGPPPEKGVPDRPSDKKADAAAQPAADNVEPTTYSGRVLGPDGGPVAGAKVYLTHSGGYYRYPLPADDNATSGADGRFRFAVSKAKFDDHYGAVVVASAANYGAGWVDIRGGGKRDNLTIQLVKDDVPITGQIVDLEGKPIPKATLTVWQIYAAPGEDIEPWVQAAINKQGLALDLEKRYFSRFTHALCPKLTTDADGRFRLTGIGRNRMVQALLEGPTIASQHVCIVTRPGKPIEVLSDEGRREYGEPSRITTYYGSDFRLAAAPCQPIVGIVRDAQTKKPIAGATVRSHSQLVARSILRSLNPVVTTTTDAEGRYRLVGMPTGKGFSIAVIPGKDQPYVARHVDVPDGVGVEPVQVDIELKRGVWIEGKITDKVTGKPLKGSVEYLSMYSNPNLRDYPGYDGTIFWSGSSPRAGAKEDGSYRIAGLPGPGVIGVHYQRDPYLRANERDDEFGLKDPPKHEPALMTAPYILFFPSNFNAIARVDPGKGAESVTCDVTLDPGWTYQGTVLGPDGKPLAGAHKFDLNTQGWCEREPMATAEFTGGFKPRHPHEILFQHPQKGLVGMGEPPKQNGGKVAVRMGAGAAVTGRLVDAGGKPRAGVEMTVRLKPKGWGGWHDYSPEPIKTDAEGRFRFGMLLPGYEFELRDEFGSVSVGDGLRAGELKDLGDVKVTPSTER